MFEISRWKLGIDFYWLVIFSMVRVEIPPDSSESSLEISRCVHLVIFILNYAYGSWSHLYYYMLVVALLHVSIPLPCYYGVYPQITTSYGASVPLLALQMGSQRNKFTDNFRDIRDIFNYVTHWCQLRDYQSYGLRIRRGFWID